MNPSQIVFITGASSGIGKACAEYFYRHGACVVLFARRKEKLEALARELDSSGNSNRVLALAGDVTDRVRVFEAMRETELKFGRVDVLINNAGAGLNALLESMDPSDFKQVQNLNVMGVLHCMQAVIPIMKRRKSGIIVNVTSIVGKRGLPSRSAYCASKFAVEGLSESVRAELAPYGIHVLVARPSVTESEFTSVEARGPDSVESFGVKRMSAGAVAREIYEGVKHRRREVTISWGGKILLLLNTLVPHWVDAIMHNVFRKLKHIP